jgi:porin
MGIISGDPYIVRSSSAGVFLIAEFGAKWALGKDNLAGRLGLGAYAHTGTFQRFNGSSQHGTNGLFAVFDQTLWQVLPPGGSSGPTGMGIFAQYGLADANVSPIDQHIGGGVQWTGPIPSSARSADILGMGASYAHLSNKTRFLTDHELSLEGFYKIQITPWFNVQPDVQYIASPGGKGLHDAIVTTIRVEMDF